MHGYDVDLAVAVVACLCLLTLAQLAPDSCESLPDVGLHARRVTKARIKNRFHAGLLGATSMRLYHGLRRALRGSAKDRAWQRCPGWRRSRRRAERANIRGRRWS